MFLFFENKKLKAIYNDDKNMKKNIIIYIIKFHISEGFYKNVEDAKNRISGKLNKLFSPNLYFMENFNNTWCIKEVEINKIYEEIKTINFNTIHTKINVKGKNLNRKDLGKNLPYIELNNFYI